MILRFLLYLCVAALPMFAFSGNNSAGVGLSENELLLPKSSPVMICVSPKAYAYHRYNCAGLKRCHHSVATVSVSEAIRKGYKPCGYCY